MSKQIIGILILTLATGLIAQEPDTPDKDYSAELPRIPALSPNESQKQFDVLDGFEIKLVASEPLVVDPVAFAFDAQGQLWVVEMRDYSEQDQDRLGRVAVLRDTDGDGVMDQRTTFVENLSWPTAIWPWLDGVLVADAPHLTWHRDTDGDSVADQSETWYVGFGRSNVQGLINSFRWGIDGRIHGATSSSGAELAAADGSKLALGRRDFSIDPITRQIRPETGGGQHGMSFNRWGDKFVTSNSDHLQQVIDIESWLSQQSSQVAMPSVRRSIAEDGPQAEVFRASPIEPWRIVRTRLRMSGVAPGIVEGGGRAAGYFTGATGTAILDHELGFGLAGESYDTAIVCDVGSNLVHRKRLVDQGFFFTGQRLDQQTELLRSRDIWFRPVQVGEGPDGALYIADMYREVIEHPASLPPMIKKHLDLTSGRDKGRIWRLSRKSTAPLPVPNLAVMDNERLVDQLSAAIASLRLMASQELIERFTLHGRRMDSPTLELLRKTATGARKPETRLLSFHLLSRMNGWDLNLNSAALSEKHPRVLAQVIELIGQLGHAKNVADAVQDVAANAKDSRVELALAKIAVELEPNDRQELLGTLLAQASDPVVRAAIATAAGQESWRLLQAARQLDDTSYQRWLELWLPHWATEISKGKGLAKFVSDSLQADSPRRQAWLGGLSSMRSVSLVQQLLAAANAQTAVDQYLAKSLEQSLTVESIGQLRLASPALQSKWIDKLIHPSVAESQQIACIDSLSWSDHPKLPTKLVDGFRSMTPSVQLVALRALVSRQDRLPKLIDGLKEQKISRSQIPADIRQSLVAHRDKSIAGQFKTVLELAAADRAEVLTRYANAMENISEGTLDKTRGKEVFQRVCAQCHRLGNLGNDVGPPLKQLAEKSPQQLLESILDPSREVDPKYMGYTVLLDDGLVITAIILQESGQQIVVGEPGGKQTNLDRQSIEELKSSGLSLMPNGLEEQITPQQMADLIRFLKSP